MIASLWTLAVVLLSQPPIRAWLFGPQRKRAVPWGGLEVLAVVFLTQFVWNGLVFDLLVQSQALDQVYGAGFTEEYSKNRHVEEPGLSTVRVSLWVGALGFPINLATVVLIPVLARRARFYQFGITQERLGRHLFAGLLCFLALTPVVYATNFAVDNFVIKWNQKQPTRHPFDELIQQAESKAELALLAFAVLVAAPIYEELLFRRLLQGWLSKVRWGGLGAFLLTLLLTILLRWRHLRGAWLEENWNELALQLQPFLFVLLTGPALVVIRKLRRPQVAGAIYGSSLLFAIAHIGVWPSPVSLFALGLGLGWLAYRSQSVVPTITVHTLFNSLAFLSIWSR
ncbi:MAG: CPBP family intramembrane glutamic endopeptidase [Gemmataceae bacterium]